MAAPTNAWLSCPHLRRLCTTWRATAAVPQFNTQASSILSAYHVLQVMYHLESYDDVLQLFQNYAHVIADNAQACVFVTIVWRYLDWAGLGWTSQQPPGMAVLCSFCCRRRSPHQLQPHVLSAFNGRRAGGAMSRPPLRCCPRHAAGYPAALFGWLPHCDHISPSSSAAAGEQRPQPAADTAAVQQDCGVVQQAAAGEQSSFPGQGGLQRPPGMC